MRYNNLLAVDSFHQEKGVRWVNKSAPFENTSPSIIFIPSVGKYKSVPEYLFKLFIQYLFQYFVDYSQNII